MNKSKRLNPYIHPDDIVSNLFPHLYKGRVEEHYQHKTITLMYYLIGTHRKFIPENPHRILNPVSHALDNL
jgi:hypothetical protein